MTESTWSGQWRVSKAPQTLLPLGARSVGHGRLQPGWRHGTGRITWTNLYWGVAGQGGPKVNGEATQVPEGHIEGDLDLGAWVVEQRRKRAAGKLSPIEEVKLSSIKGWTWDRMIA